MNAVIYYSNTNQSLSIAEYISSKLDYPLIEILKSNDDYENLILVFPVHNQGLPTIIKTFLKNTSVKNLTAIATYGKICCGNGLYEIQNKYHKNMIAGAYIPAKHTYIEEESFSEFYRLEKLIEKIKHPEPIILPKRYKNIFAEFIPRFRGKIGVSLKRNSLCDQCGICTKNCLQHAMKDGKPNSKCIRCLKCVHTCPKGALSFRLRIPLKLYLRKKKNKQFILYI